MERIIATQNNRVFLIAVSKDMGRVLSLDQGIYFAPYSLDSILARGYWEAFTGDQKILEELKKHVRDEVKDAV